jgi:hypothetical protein
MPPVAYDSFSTRGTRFSVGETGALGELEEVTRQRRL